MDKTRTIFGVIFAIGAIGLLTHILLPSGPTANCNILDYDYGTKEWRDCIMAQSEQSKSQYNTLSDCESLSTMKKISCYQEVAIKNNDISICDQLRDYITSGGHSPDDYVICYVEVGIENANVAACEKAAEYNDTYSILDADSCYLEVADKTQDPSLCERMKPGFKDLCIQHATGQLP